MAVQKDDVTASGSPDRLLALSDGIYAIAMTLLVLDVKVPDGLDEKAFRDAMGDLRPQVAAYGLSFYVLAAFWRDHRRLFLLARQLDTSLLRLTMASLGAIALLPFPTALLADYPDEPAAVSLYAIVIVVIEAFHMAIAAMLWRREHLQAEPISDALGHAVLWDLGTTAIVFGLSVPIAWLSPTAALWTWLLLIPAKITSGRGLRSAMRSSSTP
ncbi:TMEM175 family protein [Kitasatospora cineracea]|uniref:Putative membrane protein n=1 Tax=Kitasatospora cineracea TaxID=88074 RepID=A0A8G1X9U1_9ACTN|nr:TMEM175 family protein [Kitasatospora cineracea]ROR35820.1 putative membrane protein [Kitasatospora cineracea]